MNVSGTFILSLAKTGQSLSQCTWQALPLFVTLKSWHLLGWAIVLARMAGLWLRAAAAHAAAALLAPMKEC